MCPKFDVVASFVSRLLIFFDSGDADGMDFYYSKQDDARKMVEFLMAVVPSR